MKRCFAFILIVAATLFTIACNKTSGPSAGYGPNSLFPLTNGDTWYYTDSAFNDSALLVAYADTMVATKATYTDASGLVYLGLQNPNGWFLGSYISVDPSNTAVYEVDSPAFQPYTMFALVNQDGPITPNPSIDYSNPACPVTYTQIGYAAQVQKYGNACYENVELITNCNNVVLEQTNYFLSPGVGVVRIEDYLTDTVGGANKFYEDYSQTLTAKTFPK